jgi:hypothetical protein
MLRNILSLLLVVALFASVGTVVAQEDEADHELKVVNPEDEPQFAMFVDGRLNRYDVAAPVVVFYHYEPTPILNALGLPEYDEDGMMKWHDELTGIDVLRVDEATGAIDLALFADLDTIRAAADGAGSQDCCILENGPISLHYSQSGWFWVEAPEREDKIYTFAWEGFDF